MFKPRYRIIRDSYLGYEAQVRHWWFPIWFPLRDERGRSTNTYSTVEQARNLIKLYATGEMGKKKQSKVVEYLS